MSDEYRPKIFHPKAASADMTYDLMEDELTCPVCLELFADPIMLPCSHSLCKKCLNDILDNRVKVGKEGMDCPSCRKSLSVTREVIPSLPRNLALENIVFRFQEIQSRSLTKSRSLDLGSVDLETRAFRLLDVSRGDDCDEPVFPDDVVRDCGLCDPRSPSRAAWFCQQCSVLYCVTCLETFHPRRGPLLKHRILRPSNSGFEDKRVFCVDHQAELATIFCDSCKELVCHLCVCEVVGKHSGHKILALDSAWKQLRGSMLTCKEQLESMMTNLTDQNSRLNEVTIEIESLHNQAREKIESQHRRFLADIVHVLEQRRQAALTLIGRQHTDAAMQYRAQAEANKLSVTAMEVLATSCRELLAEEHITTLLTKARELAPIAEKLDNLAKCTQSHDATFKSLMTQQSAQHDLRVSVVRFRSEIFDSLKIFTGDDSDKCTSLVPTIRSVASPGKSDGPRVQNKSLITWGFNSTTFTAEKLDSNSTWTVTVQKNTNQIRDIKTGYLFGVGVSSEVLNYKDQAGLSKRSYAVVCSDGQLNFCHNGVMESLAILEALPVSVTVSAVVERPHRLVLGYTLTTAVWGDTLVGRRVVEDPAFTDNFHPVFTVSHRVKMQFPTHV